MIALTYLVYQIVHRPPWRELVKAILLAAAFVLWAANQLWPNSALATLWNDIAIALFVLDVFLVMSAGQRRRTSPSLKRCLSKKRATAHSDRCPPCGAAMDGFVQLLPPKPHSRLFSG